MHPCPDCGKEIEEPYHACLDPLVAAGYVHSLRETNCKKNERIEELETSIDRTLETIEEIIDTWAKFYAGNELTRNDGDFLFRKIREALTPKQ